MKGDELIGTCSRHGETRSIKFQPKNLKGRKCSGDKGADERILLEVNV
jgi:hypothetical protein